MEPERRKPGCIYKHPHDHECRNQDDMRMPFTGNVLELMSDSEMSMLKAAIVKEEQRRWREKHSET